MTILPSLYPRVIAVLSVTLLFITLPQTINQAHAAALSQTMVKLNRLAPNSPLSGVMCATPSTAGAGVENSISLAFPADFSLSTTPSDWTTGTTSLPSGSSPWPGISSSAQSVSGTTVTFGGNDLTSGSSLYCFSFSAADSATGPSGTKSGSISTHTSSNTLIDSKNYATTITKDQISVSATVPANPSNFSAVLTQNTSGNTFGQNTAIQYTLDYSSTLPTSSAITVEASWSLGTIEGSGIPSVDILQYTTGSASNAYGNAVPIIDPINRTITWTIPNFPANGSGQVTFTLHTTGTYTGAFPVSFTTSGRILGPGTASAYSTIGATYLYNYSPPQPPGPTSTPGPQAAPTPTPSASVPNFYLTGVSIRTLTKDSVTLAISLSQPGTLFIDYGTDPKRLSERLTSLNSAAFHLVRLTDLQPDTRYYFRITARNAAGKVIISDLYTFITATISTPAAIDTNSFIATSEKNLIFTFLDRQHLDGRNIIILPIKTLFEVQFAMPPEAKIRSIRLVVRSKNVLGDSTEGSDGQGNFSSPLLQVNSSLFAGRLESPNKPGLYEIIARIDDYNGNITEGTLSDLKVSLPFTIVDQKTKAPVEHAKIVLSLFNETSRVYDFISPKVLPIPNPSYADTKGSVRLILPMGRYRAVITRIGYEPQTVDFTLGPNPNEEYPTVYLKAAPFNLLILGAYLLEIGQDIFNSLQSYFGTLGDSRRIFDFVGFASAIIFFALTIVALCERTHLKLRQLPTYFWSLLTLHRSDDKRLSPFRGKIIDGTTKKALAEVDIFITDSTTNKILFHTKSTKQGTFRVLLPEKTKYTITLDKISYHEVELPVTLVPSEEEQLFALVQSDSLQMKGIKLKGLLLSLLAVSFELLLLCSLILTLFLLFSFGFWPVLPLLFLTFFNMIFWMLHTIHLQS